jgi:UDP-2,3-diacylglucosamine pyrophosphatase LpxH
MRRLNGSDLGNVEIDHSFVHKTADGREFWIEHGDLFDKSVTKYKLVAYLGAWLYEMALHMNAGFNRTRSRYHRRPVDFSTALKLSVKRFLHRKQGFAERLAEHCAVNGCDGIVCGHIHRPEIREMPNGVLYVNTGDWVEHRTAVVEHLDGRLELINWDEQAHFQDAGDQDAGSNGAETVGSPFANETRTASFQAASSLAFVSRWFDRLPEEI